MNGILKKKLNLLVHLARVDGNFHKSEKEMLLKLAGSQQLLDKSESSSNPFDGIDGLHDKEEILYLALQLAQADETVTSEELVFCRTLASRLGFREPAADHFVRSPLPSLAEFVEVIQFWRRPEK